MKKLPKHIIDKVYKQYKYAQIAQKARIEIEEWFIQQGMKHFDDTDLPITDVLIDNELQGNPDETVEILEELLNEIKRVEV